MSLEYECPEMYRDSCLTIWSQVHKKFSKHILNSFKEILGFSNARIQCLDREKQLYHIIELNMYKYIKTKIHDDVTLLTHLKLFAQYSYAGTDE